MTSSAAKCAVAVETGDEFDLKVPDLEFTGTVLRISKNKRASADMKN
jgi:ribosomal 50S subunit-recycling heat shock protein